MLTVDYRFIVELYKSDGALIGQHPASIDWEPAREWTRFEALRQGWPEAQLAIGQGVVEPVWHSEKGPPYVGGLRLTIADDRPGTVSLSSEFPAGYFRQAARNASAAFVKSGQLAEGDSFQFLTVAYPHQAAADASPSRGVEMETGDVVDAWSIVEGELDPQMSRAELLGTADSTDIPVLIPRAILDEAADLSRRSGEVETGGVLIGHLCRDAETRSLFVNVAAHVPARHTLAELTRLTFTAETWTHVRNAIRIRNKNEVMVGWWHSHVGREVCKGCPPERQRVCEFSQGFFSAHDRHLHRAVFPRAYNVGLVVNDAANGEITFSLFGWRRGLLENRSFLATGGQDASR